MLYRKQKKVAEVYRGGKLIGQVYKGKTKLYDVNPYAKGEVLVNASPADFAVELPRGVYKLAAGGAKGADTTWIYSGASWGASGGGGAFAEVVFFNSASQTMTIKVSASGGTVVTLGGDVVMTAHGGGNASVGNVGVGGTVEISDNLEVLEVVKAANGNGGGMAPYAVPDVASVSDYDNWGGSAHAAGGARLEYVRYKKEVGDDGKNV